MTETAGSAGAARVSHFHGGVRVGGVEVARSMDPWGISERRLLEQTRERTPDDWWRRAKEIMDAEVPGQTAGPLGLGVDFFADDMWVAVPDDVRDELQEDAYEAARQVIVTGLERHCERMAKAAAAVGQITREATS